MILYIIFECNDDQIDSQRLADCVYRALTPGNAILKKTFDLKRNPVMFFAMRDEDQLDVLDRFELTSEDEIIICLGNFMSHPPQRHFDVANVSKTCKFYERLKQTKATINPIVLYL